MQTRVASGYNLVSITIAVNWTICIIILFKTKHNSIWQTIWSIIEQSNKLSYLVKILYNLLNNTYIHTNIHAYTCVTLYGGITLHDICMLLSPASTFRLFSIIGAFCHLWNFHN